VSSNTIAALSGRHGGNINKEKVINGPGGDAGGVVLSGTSGASVLQNVIHGVAGGAGASNTMTGSGAAGGTGAGMHLSGASSTTLSGNLVYSLEGGPGGQGWGGPAGPGTAVCITTGAAVQTKVKGMTCHGVALAHPGYGHAAYVASGQTSSLQIVDSIFSSVSGVCMYNEDANAQGMLSVSYSDLFDCTGGLHHNATLASSCIYDDPMFVDPASGDFNVECDSAKCSKTVNAGKPTSDCSVEPEPNGCTVDLGAYGNTANAASKPGAEHCVPCPK
jgi:hypothetical protein